MADHDGDRALQLWSQFPVTAEPRPLVLAGHTVLTAGGFDSDEAKIAFIEGAVDATVPLAPGVLEAMCPPRNRGYVGPRLEVTAAVLATAPFLTDRGRRELPAWHVTVSRLEGTVTVLDPPVAAQAWHPPGHSHTAGAGLTSSAVLHEDGRTLTLSFIGSPREYTDYPSATAHESDTAVLIQAVAIDRPSLGDIRLAYAQQREVTASLSRPLGARVLVTPSGQPVPVTLS